MTILCRVPASGLKSSSPFHPRDNPTTDTALSSTQDTENPGEYLPSTSGLCGPWMVSSASLFVLCVDGDNHVDSQVAWNIEGNVVTGQLYLL